MNAAAAAALAGIALAGTSIGAWAMGGHFDVDDAVVVVPGHCQIELWALRAPGGAADDVHAGPACRTGPVELGLNVDRSRAAADGQRLHTTTIGPALKWVIDPLLPRVSAGIAANANFDIDHGGRPARSAYVPVTWFASDALQWHANIGRDWAGDGGSARRLGAAGEWAIDDRFSLIGERLLANHLGLSRIGLRMTLDAAVSIDVSASRGSIHSGTGWALGLNRDFGP